MKANKITLSLLFDAINNLQFVCLNKFKPTALQQQ